MGGIALFCAKSGSYGQKEFFFVMGLDTETRERLRVGLLHTFENWNSISMQMFSQNAAFLSSA